MSGDDHGHGSGHGHDSDAPVDIIPLGSWQDNLLAVVAVLALFGLGWYSYCFMQPDGIKVLAPHHAGEHGGEGEKSPAEQPTTPPAGSAESH